MIKSRNIDERDNPHSRNFGLGSRNINDAARNTMLERFNAQTCGYQTAHHQTDRFKLFSRFLTETHNIKDMRHIERHHITEYADNLASKALCGDLSIKSAHDYLSAVNTIISQARGDNELRVVSSETDIPPRDYGLTEDKSLSESDRDKIYPELNEREQIIADLQRNLGLRFEEACKFHPKEAYREAVKHHTVTVKYGTKGGQTRTLPIVNQHQLDVLTRANDFAESHRSNSMIPSTMQYDQFRQQSLKVYQALNYQTHSERHAYANARYEQLTTVFSPVQNPSSKSHIEVIRHKLNVSRTEAKNINKVARETIAKELGHHRISITNHYLGRSA